MTFDPASHGQASAPRLRLFTGKGGVGKTTMVASLAVHEATRGGRPLIVELSHRESLRAVFGAPDIDFVPREVAPGVHAMSMNIDSAVLDYMLAHMKSRRVARGIVNNKVLERLFKAMPAVGEIATLNKLRQLEQERDAAGRPRWSPIFVDLDATGHAVMFLELRRTLEHIMGPGPMRRLIEHMADMIADPARSRLSIVVTPRELPVTETIQLYRRLREAETVAFGPVYVNQVPVLPLEPDQAQLLDTLEAAARRAGVDSVLEDVSWGRVVMARAQRARKQIERLRQQVDLPLIEMPVLSIERDVGAELEFLGRLAAEGGHAA